MRPRHSGRSAGSSAPPSAPSCRALAGWQLWITGWQPARPRHGPAGTGQPASQRARGTRAHLHTQQRIQKGRCIGGTHAPKPVAVTGVTTPVDQHVACILQYGAGRRSWSGGDLGDCSARAQQSQVATPPPPPPPHLVPADMRGGEHLHVSLHPRPPCYVPQRGRQRRAHRPTTAVSCGMAADQQRQVWHSDLHRGWGEESGRPIKQVALRRQQATALAHALTCRACSALRSAACSGSRRGSSTVAKATAAPTCASGRPSNRSPDGKASRLQVPGSGAVPPLLPVGSSKAVTLTVLPPSRSW